MLSTLDAMLSTLDAVRRNKSPTENCCRVLFRTYWQISNDFQQSLYRIQCRQTLVVAVRVSGGGISVWQSIASGDTVSFRSFSSFQRWKADSIFTWVLLLALSFRRRFPLLFFSGISFCHSARLFTERSLLHIMSRHAPYGWLAKRLFWYLALAPFSKVFLKNYIPHL